MIGGMHEAAETAWTKFLGITVIAGVQLPVRIIVSHVITIMCMCNKFFLYLNSVSSSQFGMVQLMCVLAVSAGQ